ncbi:hypothetical protein C8R46DRAFT_1220569 [Mycena filopes]|nr:hypothetical protein C8R46DRAFT_1220567 [Mycena filopes]KAJ7164060.1 hypothetical protein C8R46DRAFT_1220569 [Mycena filopes]
MTVPPQIDPESLSYLQDPGNLVQFDAPHGYFHDFDAATLAPLSQSLRLGLMLSALTLELSLNLRGLAGLWAGISVPSVAWLNAGIVSDFRRRQFKVFDRESGQVARKLRSKTRSECAGYFRGLSHVLHAGTQLDSRRDYDQLKVLNLKLCGNYGQDLGSLKFKVFKFKSVQVHRTEIMVKDSSGWCILL